MNQKTIPLLLKGYLHPEYNTHPLFEAERLKDRDDILNHKEEFHANISSSLPYNIEIHPYGISKKTGLDLLKAKYNLNNDEIIFFGDALNDYEALSSEYVTIAMKNGYKELLDKAR